MAVTQPWNQNMGLNYAGQPGGWSQPWNQGMGTNQQSPWDWNMPNFPWSDWENSPWGGDFHPPGSDPTQQATEQSWWNTILPWYQAMQQGGQWGSEFDWRKSMDEWTQGFQGEQFDWQKQMDDWSKQQDVWARGLQESQLKQQEEQANLEAFGRRWKPSTRWM